MYSTGSHLQFRQQSRCPKPKSNSSEEMKCDVCSISVRGRDQFNSHLTGSKHARKVRDHESAKKIGEMPFLRFDDDSGGYECTMCNVSLNSSSVALFHVMGFRHQETTKAMKTGESLETAPDPTGTNGNAVAMKVQTEQDDQPSKQLSVAPLVKSGLPIELGCTKLAPSGNNKPIRPNFNRPSFNPNVNNANMRPLMGPTFRYLCKPLASSFVSKYTLHTVEASVSTGMNSAPRPRFPPPTGPKPFLCLACNIATNSEQQLQEHLSSEKHKNRLGSGGGPKPNVPPPPVTMSALRCESCNISVNSQMQLDQHLQSPKHRNKLKMRFQPY